MSRLLLLSLVLWGCETSDDPADPGGAGGAPQPEPPVGSVCDVDVLVAQCPPGSLPIVEESQTRSCQGGAEITDDSGAVTGICRAAESCTFICNFSDPCRCGVDRITNEGVFCAKCVTACGNAVCEGGEDPQSCPIDCAERCPPDAERCNGNHREVCEDNGLWTRLTCREDQRCIVAADPVVQALTLCETRISQGGGTFDGMGSWHPVQVEDYSPARFPIANFAFGTFPLVFLDDGRLLAIVDEQFAHVDLTDAAAPVITPLPTRVPVRTDIQLPLVHSGVPPRSNTGYLVSQTRMVHGDLFGQVWDIESGGLRNLEDFGGYPTDFQELAGIDFGPWAISPDGQRVAQAIGVPFNGVLRVSLIVWNAETGNVYRILRFGEPGSGVDPEAVPTGLYFSADGAALVAAYPRGEGSLLVIWDVAERRYARLFQSEVPNAQLDASRAGDNRVLVYGDRTLEVWDLLAEARLLNSPQMGETLGFTPDGESVFVDTEVMGIGPGPDGALPGTAPLFDPIAPRIISDGVLFGPR
jgi:hypothetical protein